jgi:hypothetical protein
MYRPRDGPLTEQTPQRAQRRKRRTHIELATAVLGAHANGRLRLRDRSLLRLLRPRGTATTAGDNVIKPALRGKRARWLGSLDRPHTLNYFEDIRIAACSARSCASSTRRSTSSSDRWSRTRRSSSARSGRSSRHRIRRPSGAPWTWFRRRHAA